MSALAARRSTPRLLVAIVAAVPFVYPFLFLLNVVFKPRKEFIADQVGLPHGLTLDALRHAWDQGGLGPALLHSLLAVGVGVVLVVLVSASGAFWLSRRSGRLPRLLGALFVSAMSFPLVIMLIPLFVLVSDAGLGDNLLVLGVVYAAVNAPFGLFFMRAYYLGSLPSDVMEAAETDGASVGQTFLRIVLPLSRPALGTLAALAFVWTWGDLLMALVLVQDPEQRTLTVAASSFTTTRLDVDLQVQAAAALVSLIPVMAVFLFAQRAIVRGITAGMGR